MEAIKINNLCKSYGKFQAVKNISFSVNKGEVFGLLGKNGAGKSTTIECVLGTKKFENGQISILGMNPQRDRNNYLKELEFNFRNLIIRIK